MALNHRQEMFIEHYLQTNNATQAAIAAGYSERTAPQIATRLLRNVQVSARIAERTAAVMRTVREMGRDAALPDYQPTFYSVWQQTVAAGKEAAMERQRVRFRQIVMRAVPLFDMAGIETKEESA